MSVVKKIYLPPVDKDVDLGIIDSWLRGVAELVPHGESARDFCTHRLNYDAFDLISSHDISATGGFRALLHACVRGNVRIDLADDGYGLLEAHFYPGEPFESSLVFGATYIMPWHSYLRS